MTVSDPRDLDDQKIATMAAWVQEGVRERAAQQPRPQPLQKRVTKPPPEQRKKQLGEQRYRLRGSGLRRLAAAHSRRPRPRQGRIGSAAARRDARALQRMRHSTGWST